jgi:hypothetical protein
MKHWVLSKTLWINIIIFIAALGEVTQLLDLFNDQQLKYVLALVALANLYLRIFHTNMGIKK